MDRALKNAADCPSVCRNMSLRRSSTTSCPTSAIRYAETYEPTPFRR